MRTFATLLILVAIAASQPHHWFMALMATLAQCLGR